MKKLLKAANEMILILVIPVAIVFVSWLLSIGSFHLLDTLQSETMIAWNSVFMFIYALCSLARWQWLAERD